MPPPSSATVACRETAHRALLRRLCWHSRRGMLELDLLLLPYATDMLPRLGSAELDAYQRLLACEDQQLHAWLVRGEMAPDGALATVAQAVRAHSHAAPMAIGAPC